MAKPKISHPKKRAFLAVYARVGSVSQAAQIAGISRELHYDWKAKDAVYAEAFEAAKALACEALEDEAVRRAHDGVEEPVFHAGQQCGTVRKYSDTLLIFLLKAANPQKYRERWSGELSGLDGGALKVDLSAEITGPSGGPVAFNLSNLTDEQLESLRGLARAAAQPGPDRSGAQAASAE